MGDHRTAGDHYYAAAKFVEADVRAIGLAYQAFEAQGKMDEARAIARQALERVERVIAQTPDDTHTTLYGASVLAFLGQKERAEEWTRRALILDPDDTLVQYNSACALVQVGDIDTALTLLERCHEGMSSEFAKWTRNDIELAPLRQHPRFIELLRKAEERNDT